MNTLPRWVPVALLLILAAGSSWLLWTLQRDAQSPPLYGPPRSDYHLIQFELITLDETGRESFSASGPALSRHPYLGTLDVEQPRFVFPDAEGASWRAKSDRAWVAEDGKELQLRGAVELDGPPRPEGGRIELRTPELVVLPETRQLRNESAVTITGPGSILRGRSLRAELDARRFRLSEVTGTHAPANH